jgi:hypothetical protein
MERNECDYYLVNRLRSGIRIKSFDGASRKRLELETELWDCRTQKNRYGVKR